MDNYKRVQEIVKLEKESRLRKTPPTMSDKIAKMNEEFGEFTAVHLENIGYKYVKDERDQAEINEHLLEELCDMYIMVMDMMNAYEFTRDEIYEMTDKKLDKWSRISQDKMDL